MLGNIATETLEDPQCGIVLLKTIDIDGNKSIDVQMGMDKGELDMDTPHGYMLNWLGQNWEMIQKMAQVSFTAYRDAKDPAKVTEAKIVEPTGLKLVSADGQSLIQQ